MKLLIIVETPDDDDLHYPRIAGALFEYVGRSVANHRSHNFSCTDDDVGRIGRTGGPNTLIASNGVRVTERRVDLPYFLFRLHDWLPRWLRWLTRWALPV